MTKHAADLPEQPDINSEMTFHRFLHDLDRSPRRRKGIGMGTLMMLVLLMGLVVAMYFVIGEVVDRIPR